jgi:hypothetical protein
MKNSNISSALSIKTKFSNAVHKILEPGIGVKRSQRWKLKKELTDKEKIALFDQISKLHEDISTEYSNCLYKNRQKKRIQKLRDENGITTKRKEKKESGRLFNHVE